MNYYECLEYLENNIIQFHQKGKLAFHKGFDKTNQLLAYLNHPEKNIPCIHIAGTNGKGSSCHILSYYLSKKGYKIGLFSSPHLIDYRERFKINNELIAENFIVSFINNHKEAIEKIQPSFFELSFAMAMDFFYQLKVDCAIIETGLGGRWDSTNIIQPILSIITNVSVDHSDILGNTIEEIALEKAGIIKENTNVVLGLPENNEAIKVFQKEAKAKNAPICKASELDQNEIEEIKNLVEILNLPEFQYFNICTCYQSIKVLNKIGFIDNIDNFSTLIKEFFSVENIPGRWQILQKNPQIILDVGHNEAAIQQIFKNVSSIHHAQLHIITGFMKDKNVLQLLDYFPLNAQYYFTEANSSRSMPHKELQNLAAQKGIAGISFPSTFLAWSFVKKQIESEDLLLVIGSFYILSEFLKVYDKQEI